MSGEDDNPDKEAAKDDDSHQESSAPVVLIVQMTALIGFIGLAALGQVSGNPVDRMVLLGLVAFGVGIRPESLGAILRKAVGA